MTLIESLLAAGYPQSEIYHHRSDLYVYATPLTQRVINKWFKENRLNRCLFVSIFTDNITGRKMYDCAFQYTPFWEGCRN